MKKKFMFFLMMLVVIFSFSLQTGATGSSYIMIDAKTNTILSGTNYHQKSLVASTAKIMTALVALENADPFEFVTIKKEDTLIEGSKIYVLEDDELLLYDLLSGLMLRSGNDAANAIAGSVFGSNERFVYQMNETAKYIGMKNSTFANASGLDALEYNLSTAYDMAILTAYAYQNEAFRTISSQKNYQCVTKNKKIYSWQNKHKLVYGNDNFILGKTGYTKRSGRILVSAVNNNNIDAIIVTINDSNDWQTHKRLCDSLKQYKRYTIIKEGKIKVEDLTDVLLATKNISIPINKSQKSNIRVSCRLVDKKYMIVVYENKRVIYTCWL